MVWPGNCRLIVTSIEAPPLWSFPVLPFPEMCEEDRKQMLDAYLELAGKEMVEEHSTLVSHCLLRERKGLWLFFSRVAEHVVCHLHCITAMLMIGSCC